MYLGGSVLRLNESSEMHSLTITLKLGPSKKKLWLREAIFIIQWHLLSRVIKTEITDKSIPNIRHNLTAKRILAGLPPAWNGAVPHSPWVLAVLESVCTNKNLHSEIKRTR